MPFNLMHFHFTTLLLLVGFDVELLGHLLGLEALPQKSNEEFQGEKTCPDVTGHVAEEICHRLDFVGVLRVR